MRIVDVSKDGVAELKWMWLPAFIGQNHLVMRELQKAWEDKFRGNLVATDEGLGTLHEFTLDWIQDKFKIKGLREYLSAVASVVEE